MKSSWCSKFQRLTRKHYYWYRLFMRAFAIELLCYGFKEDRTQVIGNKHIHLSLYKYRYLSISAWFYIIYNSKTSGFTSNSSLRCPDAKARNASLISIRLSVSIYWLKIKEWLMSKRHQRNQLKLIDCKHEKLLFILKNTQFTKRKEFVSFIYSWNPVNDWSFLSYI